MVVIRGCRICERIPPRSTSSGRSHAMSGTERSPREPKAVDLVSSLMHGCDKASVWSTSHLLPLLAGPLCGSVLRDILQTQQSGPFHFSTEQNSSIFDFFPIHKL